MKMPTLFFSALTLLATATAHAGNGNWFQGRDVDYWNEGRKVRGASAVANQFREDDATLQNLPPSSNIIRSTDFLPFDWKNYENPQSPQFWDDGGNYVPPRPLRILAVDPSDANVERYLAWQRLKVETTNRLSQLLGAHHNSDVEARAPDNTRANDERPRQLPASVHSESRIEWGQLSLSYVYRSSCPHCKHMKPVIEELARRGVRVTAYQIGAGVEAPAFPNSKAISQTELASLGVSVTPTLFIRNNQKTSKIEGYMSQEALEMEVAKLF